MLTKHWKATNVAYYSKENVMAYGALDKRIIKMNIFFSISPQKKKKKKKKCCGYAIEAHRRVAFIAYSQDMLLWRNEEKYKTFG